MTINQVMSRRRKSKNDRVVPPPLPNHVLGFQGLRSTETASKGRLIWLPSARLKLLMLCSYIKKKN